LAEHDWPKRLAGFVLCIIGLAGLLFLLYYLVGDASLWFFGRSTQGEVLSTWVERTSDAQEGDLTFRYYVDYRFETPGGTITDTSTLDVVEWGALGEGGPVTVVYFPLFPAHNRLEEGRFVPLLACAYLPLFALAWALLGGGWYLWRPARPGAWWFGSPT